MSSLLDSVQSYGRSSEQFFMQNACKDFLEELENYQNPESLLSRRAPDLHQHVFVAETNFLNQAESFNSMLLEFSKGKQTNDNFEYC